MQRLKKNYVLLLTILLFSSCGSLPSNPKVEICAHDEPVAEAECFDNQNNEYRTLPMSETNRYIMFSPDDWGLILFYIDQLERRIRSKKTKIELIKIIDTSKLHNEKNKSYNTPLF